MSKNKISWLTGLIVTFFMLSATAGSGVELNASHVVVSSVEDGAGLNTITMEVTFHNTSTIDLNSIRLNMMSDGVLITADSSELLIDSISSGSQAIINWTVNTPMPSDLWNAAVSINFIGDAQDNDGQIQAVSVRSGS